MLRAAIYVVVGPGKTIVHTDCHNGRIEDRGRPIIRTFLLSSYQTVYRKGRSRKLTISLSELISEFLGPLMKTAASCGNLCPLHMHITMDQECTYGQLFNLISARPAFKAMRAGVSSSSETISRFLLRFPVAFRSAKSWTE